MKYIAAFVLGVAFVGSLRADVEPNVIVVDGKELQFPRKLTGDDFPGRPCLVTMSPQCQGLLAKFFSSSICGTGTEKDPLRTYVKLYFEPTKKGLIYEKEWKDSAGGYGKAFDLKGSKFENSLFMGLAGWKHGGFKYKEVSSHIHPDSNHRKGVLKDQVTFGDFIERTSKRSDSEAAYRLLMAFRIDREKESLLVCQWQSKEALLPEWHHSVSVFSWHENEWQQVQGAGFFDGIQTASLGRPLKLKLEGNSDAIKFSFVK